MKIFVTVELFGGCVHEVEAYVSEEEANKKLATWEIKNEIVDENDRENQAHNRGMEFRVFECELNGLFEKLRKGFEKKGYFVLVGKTKGKERHDTPEIKKRTDELFRKKGE